MPISDPQPLIGRKQVAWFEACAPEEGRRAFADRDFGVLDNLGDTDLANPATVAGLRAAIFTQSVTKPLQISHDLKRHGKFLLDQDCQIIVRPGSTVLSDRPLIIANSLAELRLWVDGLPPTEASKLKWQSQNMEVVTAGPHVQFFGETVPWNTIANTVVERRPGPAPSPDLTISVDDVVPKLDPDAELLIRRAFAECASVHLVALDEGRSGGQVYRAYAELAGGLLEKWPQPYFVKLGDRCNTYYEYKAYIQKVDPYIPFHLGPHLVRERCCLGTSRGILVGDFVEDSESLRDCASSGRAASAIACLFDRTLFGWHRNMRKEGKSLADVMSARFPPKIDSSRFARAQALGATLPIQELLKLFLRCSEGHVLMGPVHGDLHAANVRVRMSDGDSDRLLRSSGFSFGFDAASLEASLLVEGFGDDVRDIGEWSNSVMPLYREPIMDGTIPHINPKDRSCWFHAAARQIRRHARQWEYGTSGHQYAGALALALLTKAVKDKGVSEPEASRRAAAYVFAERVLTQTFGSSVTPVEVVK